MGALSTCLRQSSQDGTYRLLRRKGPAESRRPPGELATRAARSSTWRVDVDGDVLLRILRSVRRSSRPDGRVPVRASGREHHVSRGRC